MSSTSLWYATRASGIVALVLLTVTMVLGLATTGRIRARNWPGYAQQELHRRLSIIAIVFVGIHVLTSVLDTFVHVGWLAIGQDNSVTALHGAGVYHASIAAQRHALEIPADDSRRSVADPTAAESHASIQRGEHSRRAIVTVPRLDRLAGTDMPIVDHAAGASDGDPEIVTTDGSIGVPNFVVETMRIVMSKNGPLDISRSRRYGILAGIWSATFLSVGTVACKST